MCYNNNIHIYLSKKTNVKMFLKIKSEVPLLYLIL